VRKNVLSIRLSHIDNNNTMCKNLIKILKNCFFFILLFLIFSFSFNTLTKVYSNQFVTVSYLLNNLKAMDGKEVYFKGEVIGQIIGKGNYKWVNVLDKEGNAIGIWAPSEEIKGINYFGRYNIKGDTVEIKGIFNKGCIEHGGDVDIHTKQIKVAEIGSMQKESIIPKYKLVITLILIITFGLFFVIEKIYKNKLNT
jgi:hypothetical protein